MLTDYVDVKFADNKVSSVVGESVSDGVCAKSKEVTGVTVAVNIDNTGVIDSLRDKPGSGNSSALV